jgi:cupin fold WbuC family metalloprotein
MNDSRFPKALPAPVGPVIVMNRTLLSKVVDAARQSPRRRMILPLHQSAGDSLHRMFNALQPDSYVQPHRHLNPPKAETVVVIKGAIGFVIFSDRGEIADWSVLSAGDDAFGIDTAPGLYHTFFALEPDTVVFEAKVGPYHPASAKDFADWAPREDSPESASYLEALRTELGRMRRLSPAILDDLRSGRFEAALTTLGQCRIPPKPVELDAIVLDLTDRLQQFLAAEDNRSAKQVQRRLRVLRNFRDSGIDWKHLILPVELPEGYNGKILLVSICGGVIEPTVCLRSDDVYHREILRNTEEELRDLGLTETRAHELGGAFLTVQADGLMRIWGASSEFGACDKEVAANLIRERYPDRHIIVDD